MKKIKVKVCAGKNCERSGGLKVKKLLKRLPDGLSDLVKAKECECLDLCDDDEYGYPPFVKINGKPLSTTSAGEVIAEIRKLAEP